MGVHVIVTVRVMGMVLLAAGLVLGVNAIALPQLRNLSVASAAALACIFGIALINLSFEKELSARRQEEEHSDEVGRQHPLPRAGEVEDEEHLRPFTDYLEGKKGQPDRKG